MLICSASSLKPYSARFSTARFTYTHCTSQRWYTNKARSGICENRSSSVINDRWPRVRRSEGTDAEERGDHEQRAFMAFWSLLASLCCGFDQGLPWLVAESSNRCLALALLHTFALLADEQMCLFVFLTRCYHCRHRCA